MRRALTPGSVSIGGVTSLFAGHEASTAPSASAPVFPSAPDAPDAALRVVLDTNVLVSLYIFADSRFAPLRAKIDGGKWRVVSSAACLAEFRRVLNYPQFGLAAAVQEAAYATYAACVTLIPATAAGNELPIELPRCRDRDDQKFLEAARDGAADWLVTADKALLELARRDRLRGLFRILTPEAAL